MLIKTQKGGGFNKNDDIIDVFQGLKNDTLNHGSVGLLTYVTIDSIQGILG